MTLPNINLLSDISSFKYGRSSLQLIHYHSIQRILDNLFQSRWKMCSTRRNPRHRSSISMVNILTLNTCSLLQNDPLKDLKTVFDVDWPSLQGTLYQGWRFPRRKISRLPLTRFLTTRSGRKRSVLYLKSWPFHWKGKIVNAFLIFSSPARMD